MTFDHGPDGSVAEDNYFGMVAFKEGYSFDFIEGEMWEKSPFTIYDFLQQRKRWLQGILLVVHSPHIPVSFILSFIFVFFNIQYNQRNVVSTEIMNLQCSCLIYKV